MSKIRWDWQEKNHLIDEVYKLKVKQPTRSYLSSIREAVKTLPKDRQRVIQSLVAVQWLVDTVSLKLKEVPKEQPKPEPIPELKIANISTMEIITELFTRLPKIDLLAAKLDTIIDLQHKLLAAWVSEAPKQESPKKVEIQNDGNFILSPVPKPKSRLLKVAVIGIKPNYMPTLEDIPGVEIITSYNSAHIPSGDVLFVLCDFVSHKWTDKAYSRYRRDQVFNVHGGVTALVTAIKNYQEKLQPNQSFRGQVHKKAHEITQSK